VLIIYAAHIKAMMHFDASLPKAGHRCYSMVVPYGEFLLWLSTLQYKAPWYGSCISNSH